MMKTSTNFDTTQVVAESKIIRKLSIREFLNTLQISDDVQKTLAIGFFLEKYRGFISFNKRDLEISFTEAKEQRPLNINDKVASNIKNGYMMNADEKKDNIKAWTLTSTGDGLVSQMKVDNI
ncbi:MAG TPA: hypothetical protein VJI66_02945 [Candidatus Paceibacterota bacterium]